MASFQSDYSLFYYTIPNGRSINGYQTDNEWPNSCPQRQMNCEPLPAIMESICNDSSPGDWPVAINLPEPTASHKP